MSDEILSQEEIEALISGAGAGAGDATASPEATAPEETAERADAADAGQDAASPTIRVESEPAVRPAEFSPLSYGGESGVRNGVDLILDVKLNVAVELGRTSMQVREVLSLGPGSVVELDKHAGEPVEVVVNNKTVARGEVVVIDENFGVRITEIVNSAEREARAEAA